MARGPWYPSVGDVLDIHEVAVSQDADASPGIRAVTTSNSELEFLEEPYETLPVAGRA